MCYEKALQFKRKHGAAPVTNACENSDSAAKKYQLKELNTGFLSCLQHMGHHETVIHHVEGIARRDKNMAGHLAPFEVQAAWQLGHWQLLGDLLEHAPWSGEGGHQMLLGAVFLSARRQDFAQFEHSLNQARCQVMSQLSAAAMESYSRAYPSLVKLHKLYEIEKLCQLLQEQDVAQRQRTLKKWNWQ